MNVIFHGNWRIEKHLYKNKTNTREKKCNQIEERGVHRERQNSNSGWTGAVIKVSPRGTFTHKVNIILIFLATEIHLSIFKKSSKWIIVYCVNWTIPGQGSCWGTSKQEILTYVSWNSCWNKYYQTKFNPTRNRCSFHSLCEPNIFPRMEKLHHLTERLTPLCLIGAQ